MRATAKLFGENAVAAIASEIEGSVAQVIYRSAKTAYTVLEVKVGRIAAGEGRKMSKVRKVTVVGHCSALEEGCFVRASGEWVESPRHGLQLRASSIAQVTPKSSDACKRYLRNFARVGPKRAKLLVEAFKTENVFDILESDPDRFLSVKGIGPSAVGMLVEEWKTKRTMHEACSFLHSVGIGPAIAERLAACLGGTADLCAEAVRKNPYAVVGQSKNLLTFPLADEIALTHLQLSREDERRVREGLVFTVSRLAWQGGHTCVVASEAVNATVKLLKLSSKGAVVSALAAESAGGRLPSSENGQIVSPRALFNAEDSIASDLKRIIEGTHPLPYVNVENCVRMAEKSFGGEGKSYRLAAAQAEAVRQAMKCKVLVVTGGPGVGKTTAMASIVSAFRRMKIETVVASPTGRAAAKLAQVTKQKATTLHRLLEYDPLIEGFKRNSSNRLIGGLFLVDEASMIDVELASAFFSAVPDRAVVVLVGDVDQLPAVGPGSVLQDLVSQLPSVRLDRNFRQLEESSHIVRAAHAMLKGQMIQLMPYNVGSGLESFDQFVGESDLRFMAADSPESILNGVVGVMEDLKFRFGIDPVEDVQVLTAMRKGPLGSRAFNTVLQNKFNNDAPTDQAFSSETSGVYSFRQNDKVMQIVNDYNRDVYNGEIGRVFSIAEEGNLVQVRFPTTVAGGDSVVADRIVEYRKDDLQDLEPAFACTIHKSQGCEFPVAVLPVHSLYQNVLQRNLLYTGITRATKLTVIVGDTKAIQDAIARTEAHSRQTRLGKLMKD